MLVITPFLKISESEFDLSYARSSGPGGQNVNKVNSKAVLHWNVLKSPSLSENIRTMVLQRLATRLNYEGELVISSDRFRDQIRNREDCFEKLRELLIWATHIPKARKKTKPSYSSQVKVQQKKVKHSQKKSMRRKPRSED